MTPREVREASSVLGEEVGRLSSGGVRRDRMQLRALGLLMSCLQVIPDRSQYFRYDSLSLSCEDPLNSTGWKVKRRTPGGGVRPCASGWGSASSGSTCVIGDTYPSDSGVYWCESATGNRSNNITITITDRTVLLHSPALPVSEGASVTLRCQAETNSPNHTFDFLKDGRLVGSSATGEMTVHRTSRSDEGLYVCSIPGFGESLGSRVNVAGSPRAPPPPPPPPPPAASSASASRLVCHLLVGTPYLLSTVLLGLVYRDSRRAARTLAERRGGGGGVVVEMVV